MEPPTAAAGSCSAPPPSASPHLQQSRQFLLTPLAVALTAVLVAAILLKRPMPTSSTTQSLLSALRNSPPQPQTGGSSGSLGSGAGSVYDLLMPNPYAGLPAARRFPQTKAERERTGEVVGRLSPLQRRAREVAIAEVTVPDGGEEGQGGTGGVVGGLAFSLFGTSSGAGGLFGGGGGGNGGIHPRERLMKALHSLTMYKTRSMATLERKKKAFNVHLPRVSRQVVADAGVDYGKKLRDAEERIRLNDGLCEKILRHALAYYGVSREEVDAWGRYWRKRNGGKVGASGGDHTSLMQALKHYVRDYSEEGQVERNVSFRRALGTLRWLYPTREDRRGVKVLVPGCGVGGLVWSVAREGFTVEGVEWSYYMNVVGHFVGSGPGVPEVEGMGGEEGKKMGMHVFHPYLDWWSHHATTKNMLRGINFPYGYTETGLPNPFNPPHSSSSSDSLEPTHGHGHDRTENRVFLHEGDFLKLQNLTTSTTTPTTTTSSETTHHHDHHTDILPPTPPPLQYPTILTLFFIDTARDITAYLRCIHALLPPGGVWINFGPLLYGTSPYVELSLDEVVAVAEQIGFVFEPLRKGDGGLGDVWWGSGEDGVREEGSGVWKERETVWDTLGDGKVVGVRAGYSVDWKGLGRNEYLAQGWVARKKLD